jgi:hypothetical protein
VTLNALNAGIVAATSRVSTSAGGRAGSAEGVPAAMSSGRVASLFW